MKTIKQLNEEAAKKGLHETYHETESEALENAIERSIKYPYRIVYLFCMESGYMVCVHGVTRIGYKLIKTYRNGK